MRYTLKKQVSLDNLYHKKEEVENLEDILKDFYCDLKGDEYNQTCMLRVEFYWRMIDLYSSYEWYEELSKIYFKKLIIVNT